MIIRQVVFRPCSFPEDISPPGPVLFPLCADKVSVGNFLAGFSGDLPRSLYVRREQIKEMPRLHFDALLSPSANDVIPWNNCFI